MKKYIAKIEIIKGNRREQWAVTETGLTKSGRWTDAQLYPNKKAATNAAKEAAEMLNGGKAMISELTITAQDIKHYGVKKHIVAEPKQQKAQKTKR